MDREARNGCGQVVAERADGLEGAVAARPTRPKTSDVGVQRVKERPSVLNASSRMPFSAVDGGGRDRVEELSPPSSPIV